MESTFISTAVQNIWNAWNIRGFMILSLCMQLVLALTAPFRPKTSNVFFIFVVWSAYLLVDWAALFAARLITNPGCHNSNNYDVLAFWTAFILMHLGGPDTITAFSLDDNVFWPRQLAGLINLVIVFPFIFVKTLPHNTLLVPTTMLLAAGVIKYLERTQALYLASRENPEKSFKETTSGIEPQIQRFLDHTKCKNLREFILTSDHQLIMNMIFLELQLLYEVLYTKIKGANSGWGKFVRSIAYLCTLAAFILFCLVDKQEFHGVDIAITYALLGGVFILHVSTLLMLLTSQFLNQGTWMGALPVTLKEFIRLTFGQGFLLILVVYALHRVGRFMVRGSAIERFLDRQWSEKMGSFNLLSHCFKQGATTQCQKPGKLKFVFCYSVAQIPRVLDYPIDSCTIAGFIWNKLAEMRHTSRKDFDPEVCKFVFEDLKRKTKIAFNKETKREVYEARGDWALQESGYLELKPYINDFEYDNTLLIWHVATEICYNIEGAVGDADKMKRFSKLLSDYMMYLLVKQPNLMSPVAGITHIRYEDTYFELKLLRRKLSVPNMQSFCAKILEELPDITEPTDEGHRRAHSVCPYSVLKVSFRLVRLIRDKNNRWEVIFNVWMELLSYAASHSRADSHMRLLSEGGEFITFVWMWMACYGIGA